MKVIFSDLAIETLSEIVEFLLINWTEKEISVMENDEQVLRAFELGAVGYVGKNSWFGNSSQAVLQVANGGGRLQLPRNGQGMVGKIGEQVDKGQNAHGLPLVCHHDAVDVMPGHEQQGVEKIVVLFAAQQ